MQTDIACKSLGADSHGDAFGRVCYLRGDVWRGQIRDRVLPLLKAFGASRRDIMVRLHDWASTESRHLCQPHPVLYAVDGQLLTTACAASRRSHAAAWQATLQPTVAGCRCVVGAGNIAAECKLTSSEEWTCIGPCL